MRPRPRRRRPSDTITQQPVVVHDLSIDGPPRDLANVGGYAWSNRGGPNPQRFGTGRTHSAKMREADILEHVP